MLLDKLKPLVNNKDLYDVFLDYLNTRVKYYHSVLEQAPDDKDLHKAQGSIKELRRLMKLREEVNNG